MVAGLLQTLSIDAGYLAGLIVAVGIIWRATRNARNGARWFFRRLSAAAELVEKELTPNGGESIHDRAGKILAKVLEHDAALHRGAERFDRIEERLDNMGGTVSYESFPRESIDRQG